MTDQNSATTLATPNKRRAILLRIASLLLTISLALLGWWFFFGQWHTSTDDAYVGGNIIAVTPLTGGISLSGLPAERVAAASGLTNFMRNLGASFGTAITTWLWTSTAAEHHARLVENIHPYNPVANDYLNRLHQLGMPGDVAYAYLEQMINAQSYTLATDQILTISALLMLSLVTLIWWAKPPFVAGRGTH